MNTQSTPNHLNVFVVKEFEGKSGQKARNWIKVGAAFPTKDGTGFTVELRAIPVDGRLVLPPPLPQQEASAPEDTKSAREVAPARRR